MVKHATTLKLFDAFQHPAKPNEVGLYINGRGVMPIESERSQTNDKAVISGFSREYYKIEFLDMEGDPLLSYDPIYLSHLQVVARDYVTAPARQYNIGDLVVGVQQGIAETMYAATVITEVLWEQGWIYSGYQYRADGLTLDIPMAYTEAECAQVWRTEMEPTDVLNPYYEADLSQDFQIRAKFQFLEQGETVTHHQGKPKVKVRRKTDQKPISCLQSQDFHHQTV